MSGCAGAVVPSSGTPTIPAALLTTPRATPAVLATLPLAGATPEGATVLLPVTHGIGSASLPVLIPDGTIYVETTCVGIGMLKLISTNNVFGVGIEPCVGQVTTTTAPAYASDLPKYVGKPMTLRVTADPSMTWSIYIAELPHAGTPLP